MRAQMAKAGIIGTLLGAGVLASVAMGQNRRPGPGPGPFMPPAPIDRRPLIEDHENAMEVAFHREFPDLRTEIADMREINGVRVGLLRVRGIHDVVAAMTERGDFLLAGIPVDPARLPASVDDTVRRLFARRPTDALRYLVTDYHVSTETDGHRETLVYDAVGRLKNILPEHEFHDFYDHGGEDLVHDRDLRRHMDDVADRLYGPDAEVIHIFRDHIDHFYQVVVSTRRDGEVELDTDGTDIYLRRKSVSDNDAPRALRASINHMFPHSRVLDIKRQTTESFQFEERSDDGAETVTLRVATNGTMLNVDNRSIADDRASVLDYERRFR